MDYKILNRIVGFVIFIIVTVVYFLTVQPTLSLWDCGEFLACAFTLSVPHPPGAPLHILVGKIFTMFPTGTDIGFRMNLLSVFASSFSVLCLYLVSVKLIKNWRGTPKNIYETLLILIPSAIGALSLGFSDSFWFNAMEAEVYGFGTLLTAASVYLAMLWWEKADEEGSDKYLLLIAYISGLALGIHLLVVQMIFIAGLIYYFRRFKYDLKTFIFALIISTIAFWTAYPIITKQLPNLINKAGLIIVIILLAVLVIGIFYTYKNKTSVSKIINFSFFSIFLVILGYSTYISVLQRANVKDLPINENRPDNIERLLSYLNREQYGEQPLILPRRYSQDVMHTNTWKNYSSDMDFMFKYQINKMFNRYLFWQYIGRESYEQDAGVDISKFFAIPFIIGMLGLFIHFRKDWKLALVFLIMFIMMGVVTALYQNQQDPQPRERDYFYIGAFFVFSVWISIGLAGVSYQIKDFIKGNASKFAIIIFLLLGMVFIPFNMARVNYKYQNRANNYLPYDYAYNLLQSCDKDGILITNGDNDTFPLWCLQAVYGVRQDIRIINLSLAQIDWYNLQLKNERPYGSKTIPLNFTDDQVKRLRPSEWDANKVMTFDVPANAYPDTMKNKPEKMQVKIIPRTQTYQGKQVNYLNTPDLLVLDMIKANKWERPVYFSSTVSDDNYIGFNDYLLAEGMVLRIVPYKTGENISGSFVINKEVTMKCLISDTETPYQSPHYGFLLRNLNDNNIFFEQVQRRMIESFRMLYVRTAYSFADDSLQFSKAKEILSRMESKLPRKVVEMDFRIKYDLAMLYHKLGELSLFNEYSAEIEKTALSEVDRGTVDMKSYYNPYRILLDLYDVRKEYNKEMELLEKLSKLYPNDPSIVQKKEVVKLKISGEVIKKDDEKNKENDLDYNTQP